MGSGASVEDVTRDIRPGSRQLVNIRPAGMGVPVSTPIKPVETEGPVVVENYGILWANHSPFTVSENVVVTSKKLDLSENKALHFIITGAGVLRIGILEKDPYGRNDCTQEAVYEREIGLGSGQSERYLYIDNGCYFCFGNEIDKCKEYKYVRSKEFYVYVLCLFGEPKLQVKQGGHTIEWKETNNLALNINDNGTEVQFGARRNKAIVVWSNEIKPSKTYTLEWDMVLWKQKISEKEPKYGFLRLGLTHKKPTAAGFDFKNLGDNAWFTESAVIAYPYSDTIAFKIDARTNCISHNVLVESVNNVATEPLNLALDQRELYLVAEICSGELSLLETSDKVQQTIGSTFLVEDFHPDDTEDHSDVLDKASSVKRPCRLQFGCTDTKFVIEYRKRVQPKVLENLRSNVTSIGEVKTVQIVAEPGEDLSSYDVNESFTREYGDNIIITEQRRNEIWIITFKTTEDARTVWMENERVIERTKVTLLPYYHQIGVSKTKGIKPTRIIESCSIEGLDEAKLKVIKKDAGSRKKLEDHLKTIPNITILWDTVEDDEMMVDYSGFESTWKETTTTAVKSFIDEFSLEDNIEPGRPVTYENVFPKEHFEKIRYIDKKGELSRTMRGFPSSRYSIDEARCEVKLKGTDEEQIRQAYNKIQKLLLKIDIIQISISKPLAKCIKESKKSALLIQTLQDVKNDDFDITDDKCVVWLVASSERENQIRKTRIENTIRGKLEELFVDQEEVPIQSCSLQVLKTDNWKKLTKTMLSKYVYIKEDTVGLKLVITTAKERFQDAKSQVTTFLGDTAMETVKLYIGRNAVSYLTEYPSEDVTGAKKIDFLKDVHGDLNGYVQISGTHSEIADIQEKLKDTQRNIKVVRFKISKPWLASATIMKLGNESSFEYDNKCILNMEIADYLAEEYVPCIAVLKESGCCIFVMQTDITMSTCDVIVNCTDIKLQNKHGLSKALCDAAGDKVQNECIQYIKKHNHLELGKVFMSSPGKLQCHKIIHAACPRWDEKQEAKKELITSIVTNALTAADNENMTSIILPAVGYVRGGKIPIKECAIEITNAVSNYMSQNKDSFLREIFLADLQQDKIDAFTEAVEKCFTTTPHFVFKHGRPLPKIDKSSPYDPLYYITPVDISQLSIKSTRFGKTMGATRFTKKHRRADDMRFHPNAMPQHQREQLLEDGNVTIHVGSGQGTNHDTFSSGLPFNIDISDTLTLHVETGAMESQNVDIIVNTTANFPHMGSAVSRALLRAGGKGIEQECKDKGDAEFKQGKVVRTSGGYLKCKHIYHTKIELGWKREGVEGIYNTVTKCLLNADKFRCRSISFPSIGTGGSNFPADKVANGMVRAVCDFTRDYPNSPVKDVHIVIFHADYATIKIFEQEIPVLLKPAGLADNLQPGTVIGGNRRAKPKFKYTNPGNHSAADDVVIVKAITTGDVKTLIKEFEKLVDDQYEKRSIDYGNELKNLSESEEILIKSLGKGHYMSLEIDKKKKEVKLSGLKENIHKVETNVRMMITNEIPQLREKHERGEQIARTVEWHYEDNGKQCPVSAPNNYEIHMNYLNGQDFEYKNILDGKTYKVLFASLEEHEVGQPNKKRRLYQKTKLSDDGIELPTLWTISTSDNATHREPLAPSDPEFIDVKTELRKANCPFKSIVNIIRIEDKYKWLQYETKKRQMEKQNPNSVTNERRLWHGTDSDTVDKIITGGYDRSFRGKNATVYGNGVYFAVGADYSHRYAHPDPQGVQRIFYSRVLVGEYCQGIGGMDVLPVKGTNNLGLNVLYDSAVDNMRTPVMYVIFHDTQAYPEYLIEYN